MTDFLGDLVARSLGLRDVVRPRLPLAFERLPIELEPAAPAATAPARSPVPQQPRPGQWSRRDVAREAPAQPPPERGPAVVASPEAPSRPFARERMAQVIPAAPSRSGERLERGSPAAPTRAQSARETRIVERTAAHARTQQPAPRSHVRPAPPDETAPAVAQTIETRFMEQTVERETRREVAGPPAVPRAALVPTAAPEREQVVHVHIDRIEVRVPAKPEPRRAPRPREPRQSLAEYLAEGKRRSG